MEYPNIGRAFKLAILKHKRKLIIGGAVIGAAALLGGSIYGGLYNHLELQKLKDTNKFVPSEPIETTKT